MKHFTIFISLMLLAVMAWGCKRSESPKHSPDIQRAIGTVDLVVNFGDGQERIEKAIPCSARSTVLSTLARADQQGDLRLDVAGSGETAFVTGINDFIGDTKTGKYWFFYLNDELAKQGCGSVKVRPGDQVQWHYQPQPADFAQ